MEGIDMDKVVDEDIIDVDITEEEEDIIDRGARKESITQLWIPDFEYTTLHIRWQVILLL
jgi:hypothetical protein